MITGKNWIICALARQACRNRYRARYTRIPDLEEEWRQADGPHGRSKLLKRYSAYAVLALDEWLFDPPEGSASAPFCSSLWNDAMTPAEHPVCRPIPLEGLAPATRRRHPRRCHYGQDCAQHHLDRNRRLKHARTRHRQGTINKPQQTRTTPAVSNTTHIGAVPQ
ncbi:ATP-binding protein [Bifidobacterium biavatii]|uniref:IstB-like ATP binding protein domain-containing protein n=1 Tax=Bifidobacterium biavatii DSM 23969 TaxID=1437608 RepID=A0A086ZT07_9BIFI|nr:IstB-like ATP binding protein domain-containing protein [Bifidobacterium biavatii DSM 23969]